MSSQYFKAATRRRSGVFTYYGGISEGYTHVGTLTIEVPPDFVADETSGDVMIGEGAKGVPQPRVNWRREDGKDIIIRESVSVSNGQKSKTTAIGEYHGEELRLTKISRHDMGAYLCIASNGVPPAIIPPVIHVPNQLVGAPLGTDVSLECFVEASPKSINYWMKDNEEMIIASSRRDVQAVFKSSFQVRMLLNIRNLQKQDLGSYRCVAKNSLGSVDVSIRLSEISGSSRTYNNPLSPYYEERDGDDETVMSGTAELDKMDNKAYSLDNTVQGHVGGSPPSRTPSPLPTMKINRRRPTPVTNSSSSNCVIACGIKFFYQCHNINLIAIVFIMIRFSTSP
ncbi:hypothetical protein PV328_007120 [Microctonus aethiopoides]|uniref:Ig-like domain-containing protein n=1 Tax=Microctonus aethiopoides TaxID=144406 RepID=A0AA39FQW4_9HYME|nr:hypothetical protein PV328_007120 [Microctonus aethiopoides]